MFRLCRDCLFESVLGTLVARWSMLLFLACEGKSKLPFPYPDM